MSDTLERDAGFCSGGEEDDMEGEDGIHSPTDVSEDSVDVKVQAISLRNKNKRKSAEPRRLDTDLPAKKRKIDLAVDKTEKEVPDARNSSPFRPWSASPSCQNSREDSLRYPVGRQDLVKHGSELSVIFVPRFQHPSIPPGVHPEEFPALIRTAPQSRYPDAQEEPLSLVSKKRDVDVEGKDCTKVNGTRSGVDVCVPSDDANRSWHSPTAVKDKYPSGSRTRNCKGTGDKKLKAICVGSVKSEDGTVNSDNKFRIDSLLSSSRTDGRSTIQPATKPSQGGQQRNYKNMTRERRIEANARERTRVHTISAAFDTLRHSIPAYSHNQKLSKLSVLRIACSYIMTLSRLAGCDYSKDHSEPEVSSCVENVSRTIQTEGKIRKKKDD